MSARNASVIEADPFKIVLQLFRSVADDIDPAEKEKVFFFAGSTMYAKRMSPFLDSIGAAP